MFLIYPLNVISINISVVPLVWWTSIDVLLWTKVSSLH